MPSAFENLFRSPVPARDKLLARLFGIFNEDVVRIWSRCSAAPYENLGRPTLRRKGSDTWATLDFLLASRDSSRVFVAEMKCELEYENYKYLTLTDSSQLRHHRKPAFDLFLQAAADPSQVEVKTKTSKGSLLVHGAVLVWGDATARGRAATIARYGFADVLTVSRMVQDLNRWQPPEWAAFITDRRRWTTDLFDGLTTLAGG
jgi:hypothetical protein